MIMHISYNNVYDESECLLFRWRVADGGGGGLVLLLLVLLLLLLVLLLL